MSRSIGSYFDLDAMFGNPLPLPDGLPSSASYFRSGRHAFAAVIDALLPDGLSEIWFPSYYCGDVIEWIDRRFTQLSVQCYVDSPWRVDPPRIEEDVSARRLIVFVDYFGIRSLTSSPVVGSHDWSIADVSHDPCAYLGRELDRFDYALASLRKRFPIPDGGLVLPTGPAPTPSPPDADVLASDELAIRRLQVLGARSAWDRDRSDVSGTDWYQRLQPLEGDVASGRLPPMSRVARMLLSGVVPVESRGKRGANAARLVAQLEGSGALDTLMETPHLASLSSPLVVPVLLRDADLRDELQQVLARDDVYAAVHWRRHRWSAPETDTFADRQLSLPCDERYSLDDMNRVAESVLLGLSRLAR
jgi:hypothetical protein